jgi:hypothetical protein
MLRALILSSLVAAVAAASGTKATSKPSIKATDDGLVVSSDITLDLGDAKVRSLRAASDATEDNAKDIDTIEEAIAAIATLNTATQAVEAAVKAEQESCDAKQAQAVLDVQVAANAKVEFYGIRAPECPVEHGEYGDYACTMFPAGREVRVVGRGFLSGADVDGVYECGFTAPDSDSVFYKTAASVIGGHQLSCYTPFLPPKKVTQAKWASQFMLGEMGKQVPFAGPGNSSTVTFRSSPPEFVGEIADRKIKKKDTFSTENKYTVDFKVKDVDSDLSKMEVLAKFVGLDKEKKDTVDFLGSKKHKFEGTGEDRKLIIEFDDGFSQSKYKEGFLTVTLTLADNLDETNTVSTSFTIEKVAAPDRFGAEGREGLISSEAVTYVREKLGKPEFNMKMCYSARRDGWSTYTFHRLCDNKGGTLLISRHKNVRMFGGYIHASQHNRRNYYGTRTFSESEIHPRNKNSFGWPFRINPDNSKEVQIAWQYRRAHYGYYMRDSYAMVWGGGHDFTCEQDFRHCYCNFGYCYRYKDYGYTGGKHQGSSQAKNFCVGTYVWNARNDMTDYEVYLVDVEGPGSF